MAKVSVKLQLSPVCTVLLFHRGIRSVPARWGTAGVWRRPAIIFRRATGTEETVKKIGKKLMGKQQIHS